MRSLFALALLNIGTVVPAVAQEQPVGPVVIQIVNQIEFTGNTVISDEDLLAAIPIKAGELLTVARLQQTVAAVERAYQERGYLAVVTDDVIARLRETGVLTLPVAEVRVAEVRIQGLRRTRGSVIRRLLELQPGALYNVFALRLDAARLQALGIFESVDAKLERRERPGEVIVLWELVEREKTGYISFGGSYSPSDNLVGSIVLTQVNLRGRAEQLRVAAAIGSIRGRLSGEVFYLNPLFARRTSLSLRVFSLVRYRFPDDLIGDPDIGRYFERRTGAQVIASRSISPVRQFSLGTRYESLSVSNLPLEFLAPGVPSSEGTIAALSSELRTDRGDFRDYPTRGGVWRAFAETGRVDLDEGGINWIGKVSCEVQRFIPLGRIAVQPTQAQPGPRPRVIAVRLFGGTSAGDLPFFEQYFLGGVGGLRGYREGRFWGKHVALATAEYRVPISQALVALAFVDAGDAWASDFQFVPGVQTDFQQHEEFSSRAGAGVGIRYAAPLGTIGIDFAWGEEFRTHLVIGQTF